MLPRTHSPGVLLPPGRIDPAVGWVPVGEEDGAREDGDRHIRWGVPTGIPLERRVGAVPENGTTHKPRWQLDNRRLPGGAWDGLGEALLVGMVYFSGSV